MNVAIGIETAGGGHRPPLQPQFDWPKILPRNSGCLDGFINAMPKYCPSGQNHKLPSAASDTKPPSALAMAIQSLWIPNRLGGILVTSAVGWSGRFHFHNEPSDLSATNSDQEEAAATQLVALPTCEKPELVF